MNVLKDNEILLFDRLNQARNIDQITVVFKGLMRALEDGTRRFEIAECDHDWQDQEGNPLDLDEDLADLIDEAVESRIGMLMGSVRNHLLGAMSSDEPDGARGAIAFNVPARAMELQTTLSLGAKLVRTYQDGPSQDAKVVVNKTADAIIQNVVRRLSRNQSEDTAQIYLACNG
jgi:hypothetical protein